MNAIRFAVTTVAPVCKPRRQAVKKPAIKHTRETETEHISTPLNVVQTRIAVMAGKTISAEIINEPIIFMPSTIVSAVKTAISILYKFVLMPVAFEKFSSNVTANIFV